ncbi:MAG: SusD/RagB family nutrient-binding outer membrane lipoprotein [Lewinellaceae bacterium]|nr:SusD/RagB family nutrient-binding outer membrane lipoprotein [Lewinellaceae bacterium]
MKYILKFSLVGLLFFLSACDLTDLDANLENPNNVSVDNLDVNLLMNKIQSDFGDFFAEADVPAMELSRMMALTGGDVYERAYQAQDHNDIWNRAYQDVLIQIETLLGEIEGTTFTIHAGSAKILKAYIMMTLVDLFGDVPYSEALRGGEGIFNPKVDDDATIYQTAVNILDDAIADLGKTGAQPLARDIFYGGSAAKWIALANTLKLKAYLNLSLTNEQAAKGEIAKLLGADLIDSDAEEFTYKYGTADVPARSRHPWYRNMYQPSGEVAEYLSNYYMLVCYEQKGVQDPRWRYYFYRQVGSIDKALEDEPEAIPCVISPRPSHYGPNQAWCAFDPGFFGRDHGNSDGIPPDDDARTTVGVYPCGGRVDLNDGNADYAVTTRQGQGANGAGIEPIWMAFFTDFVKAEAALMLGTEGDAKTLMIDAVNKSINRVRAFADAKGQSLPAGLEPSTDDYIAAVEALWDAAGTTDAKLDVLMKEYYIALWGNGVEAYNLYRRTGKPSDMQPMRAANPGSFLRSLIYPADFVNLNSNVTQKSNSTVNKVFWDNNPDDFIK